MTALAAQLPTLHTGDPIVMELVDGTRNGHLSDLVLPLIHLPAPLKAVGVNHNGGGIRYIALTDERIRNGAPYEWPTCCGWTGVIYLYCDLFCTCDLCPSCHP